MLDGLGFHTDRDYQAELDTLNTQIHQLTEDIRANRFHSPEARTSAHSKLCSLHARIPDLERNAEVQNQRLDGLADAIRAFGDLDLGVVAYLVFGPAVLPC